MMDTVFQVTALCVTAALLGLVVKKAAPETALVLTLAAVAVGLLALSGTAEDLAALFRTLQDQSGLGAEWFAPLYKTVGIAIVVRIGGELCRDAGEKALAGVVETAGTLCALAVAAPLMEAVLGLLGGLQP